LALCLLLLIKEEHVRNTVSKVNRLFCNVSSHFVIKEEVFIHKKVFTDPLA